MSPLDRFVSVGAALLTMTYGGLTDSGAIASVGGVALLLALAWPDGEGEP